MAGQSTEEILKFVMQAEGESALVPFIKSANALKGASVETKAAADALLTELTDAAGLKKSIESFQKLEATIAATGEKSTTAKAKVDQLAAEIAATEEPTKKQTKAFQDATRSAEGLEKRLKAQRDELAILRAGLDVAGVSTSDFAKAQIDITARCTAARTKLEELAKSTENLSAKTTAAGTETGQFGDKLGILRKAVDVTKAKLGEIADGVGGLSTRFTELNQTAELAGKVLGTIGSIGNFLGDQITEVGKFELALGQVQVRTKATADESRALRAAIQDALQNYAVSADAAANALRLLAEDGASATEAAQNLGQTVAYAQANTRGLAETVQGLGQVLDTFNEAPAKIGALADAITATAAAAGTSTKAIEDGLAGVGVAATQAGLGLDEAVAMIGTLAQRGVEGTRAGASLTKVLQELADPASKAGEALRQAGIDGSDMSGVLQQLATNSSAAESVMAALGDRPRAALKLLLADGGKALAGITAALKESEGAAKAASDQLGDKFALAWQRAANAIENARNTFLEPILEPLAKELNGFATDFNNFANSPEFARLADQFRQFATKGIQALGDLARSIDFEAATGRIADFAESTITAMERVATVINFVGGTFGAIWDTAAAAGNSAIDVIATGNQVLIGSFAEVSTTAAEVSRSYGNVALEARKLRDESLTSLGARFGLTTEEAHKFGGGLDAVAEKARQAKLDLDALAKALPKNDIVAIAERWGLLGKGLDKVGDAAGNAKDGLEKLRLTTIATDLAFERMQVGTLLRAMDLLMAKGLQASDSYKALNAQFLASEGRINALTAEQEKLTGATDQVANSADHASESLRNYGNAAGSAADAADRSSSSNSQVADSFGNIGNQASEAQISLGNLTEEFTRQALAAAGTAKSAGDYIDTLNRQLAAGAEQDKRIAQRIEMLRRQNAALDEEAKLRKHLELIYGTSSTRLDELVQLELQRQQVRERSLDLGRQEIEQEKERQSLTAGAGAFGTSAAATSTADSGATVASSGKSSVVEIVVRNEQNAAVGSTRISNDQVDQIARRVLDAIGQHMRAGGR